MKSIKVRFNLGRGKNFMKWKIQYPDGKIEYHSPDDVQLVMSDCILKNHKKTAQKIFDGGEKVVCAWVLCKSLELKESTLDTELYVILIGDKVSYNPRVTPHWMLNGENVDGMFIHRMTTVGKGVYKLYIY
jgi:hypothetical protein